MSTTTRPEKTVLVVEDDPWIRSLMADLLAGEGYSVVQASDGKAGLELAEENEPDVILLDLAMPEKSGLDVLHELKSSKPTRDIPVIVVSAYAMLMMGSDARRADGVIQKPFDLADLLLQVEQAATKRRQTANQRYPSWTNSCCGGVVTLTALPGVITTLISERTPKVGRYTPGSIENDAPGRSRRVSCVSKSSMFTPSPWAPCQPIEWPVRWVNALP